MSKLSERIRPGVEAAPWVIEAVRGLEQQLAALRASASSNTDAIGWVRAADDELVCAHLGVANPSDTYEVARAKLIELIAWHVDVATDPAVNGGYRLTRAS